MSENKAFDFQKFINDSKQALVNPKEYFSRIELTGGIGEPLIKALIYGAVAGIFTMIWSYLHIGAALGGVFGGAIGVTAFFFSIMGAIIGVFIGGLVVLILSSICGGNNDFEANLRVAVAIMVIFPVSAFFNFLGGLHLWLGAIVGLAINLYSLYMLYFGLTVALKNKEQTAKVLMYVMGGLLILFMLIGAATRQAARSFSGFSSKRIEKEFKRLEKDAKKIEKAAAKLEDTFKEIEKDFKGFDVDDEDDFGSIAEKSKPSSFPIDALEKAKDWFVQGEPALSFDKIENLVETTSMLRGLEENQLEMALDVLSDKGYSGMEEYVKDMVAAASALETLRGLSGMQAIVDAPERKVAEGFTIDKAMESIVKQTIANGKLTYSDMQIAYDNWDKIERLSAKKD